MTTNKTQVESSKYNKETIDAMAEAKRISNYPNVQSYSNKVNLKSVDKWRKHQ